MAHRSGRQTLQRVKGNRCAATVSGSDRSICVIREPGGVATINNTPPGIHMLTVGTCEDAIVDQWKLTTGGE